MAWAGTMARSSAKSWLPPSLSRAIRTRRVVDWDLGLVRLMEERGGLRRGGVWGPAGWERERTGELTGVPIWKRSGEMGWVVVRDADVDLGGV